MAQIDIDPGAVANDGTGDELRDAWIATQSNFDELYARWTTASGNIYRTTGLFGLGRVPVKKLDVTVTSGGGLDTVGRFGSSGNGDAGTRGAAIDIEVPGSSDQVPGARIAAITQGGATSNQDTDLVFYASKGGTLFETHRYTEDGVFRLAVTPVYANNAAALVGGLVAGDVYKTASTGDATLMITNAT